MKTNNPIIDNVIEAQTTAVNTWIDSAKKFQSALASGHFITESQAIYKEMMEKQTALFGGVQPNSFFGQTKPEEFFKNWYTQQMAGVKQATDFSQSMYNSFANYGKNASDYTTNFTNTNNAWTSIYNSWMNAIQTTYDTFSKNMNNPLHADVFKTMFEGNQTYLNVQELFQPMIKALQNADFSADTWKNIYNTDHFKKTTEQLFSSFFSNASLKEVYENATKQVQQFFVNQNNLGKEYYTQLQNMSTQFPELFSGNAAQLKNLYTQFTSVFGKTFDPLLKLVNPGKEKENIEATIALMDKVAEYTIKQSELQLHLYKTTQTSMEAFVKETQDKYKNMQAGTYTVPTPNDLYNDWIKTNEQLLSELFATEEFSKAKAEALNLSMELKKQFEKQFEQAFVQYPVVFKSQMDEVYQTLHDLKKTVKDLQAKLALKNTPSSELFEEDKTAKPKKK